ncbi:MAG: 50S ribosomal protein L11 methyltransferase [Candidatus Puniceispirillales bacterium]
MSIGIWQVTLKLDGDQDIASEILQAASDADTISFLRDHDDDPWDVICICQSRPDQIRLDLAVTLLTTDFAMKLSPPEISNVPDIDWLEKNWLDMKPLDIGRFWIYGTHISDPLPAGKTGIQLDAGMAFGTGNHATTHGCILLAEKYISPHAPLTIADIGAGSGILAMVAAKINPSSRIIAVDNDPVAVEVMQQNILHNQTQSQITCGISEGYDSALITDHMPFDVIMANILPTPLIAMANDAARVLRAGGKIILSGLNLKHADDVISAHQAAGLSHVENLPVGDWMSVIMQKPDTPNDGAGYD